MTQRQFGLLNKPIQPGPLNHRMVGVGRDLCGSSSPTPLPKQGHLQQAAQELVQASLEYLQRRRLHNPSGQPVPVLHHPQSEPCCLVLHMCLGGVTGVATFCCPLVRQWSQTPLQLFCLVAFVCYM